MAEEAKLLVYLIATSRKLPRPLSGIIGSGSGAGKSFLAELAEQRESELAATAEAAAERLTAAPYRQSHTEEPQGVRPPPAARSIPRLLPGDVVRLGGLSGPRGEELNGRSSTGSKCHRALYPRSHVQAGLGRPTSSCNVFYVMAAPPPIEKKS